MTGHIAEWEIGIIMHSHVLQAGRLMDNIQYTQTCVG